MKEKSGVDFRSNLGKVKGLGSGGHAVSHWWLQRLTAIALVPLCVWFMSSVISVMISPNVLDVARWFSLPINALFMILLVVAMFYHAKLGLQVVIEDYIKCPCTKYGMLIANSFFCFAGGAVCIIAILKLHFLNIAGI